MRVLINTIPLYGKTPGLRTYTANLLRALHASDADMDWHVLLQRDDVERLGLGGDHRFHPIALSRLTGLSTIPGVRFVWRNATEQLLLASMSTRFDLVHYLDSYGPLLVPGSAPVALTVHDLIPLGAEPYFSWWARAYLAALMRRTIPRARALLAVSAHTARQLTARLGVPPERIVVVPNGIDAAFHPRSASARLRVVERYGLPERYVIYAGSVHPRKNVARLIRAFASARRERALPHHLILVGGLGWRFDDVLAAMREVNAASAAEVVRSLGRVPDVDLAPLIAGADCLAYPSLDEGFGLPVVEAMACGTPVLTSRVAALEEVAGDAAILVAPHDERAIADALGALCTEPTLRERLRARGLAQAARFRWSAVADETIRVYLRLAGALPNRAPDASSSDQSYV